MQPIEGDGPRSAYQRVELQGPEPVPIQEPDDDDYVPDDDDDDEEWEDEDDEA